MRDLRNSNKRGLQDPAPWHSRNNTSPTVDDMALIRGISPTNAAAQPDLAFANVEIEGDSIDNYDEYGPRFLIGDRINLSWDVRNRGTGDAGESRVAIWLHTGVDGARVDTEDTSALDAGEYDRDESGSFVIPSTFGPGQYGIQMLVDDQGRVSESNEGNNEFWIFFWVEEGGEPDLIIEDVKFNGTQIGYGGEVSVRAGDEITLGWDVRNRGDGDAALSRAGIYLLRDGQPAQFLDWESSGSLDAGEVENDESDTFTIPADLAPGVYRIEIRADHEDAVDESSESNNEFLIWIRVEGAPTVDDYRDEASDTSAALGSLDEQEPAKTGIIGPADANDTYGDKDVFRVTLTQGQTYLFTMTGVTVSGFGALSQSIFTVRSGSNFNTILATSSEGATAQMEFYAATGGTYYLRAGAGGPNFTSIQGGYRVTLQPATDGTTDISAYLQTSGSYSKVGYVGGGDPLDVFTLTVPATGGKLTVDLTGLSADIDIRVLTEQGEVLDRSSLNGTASEHAVVTLAAGDRVRIEIAPYGTAQSNYQLNVHFDPTASPPITPLPSSASLVGDHLLRTLAEFAAGAYGDSDGSTARAHLIAEGWSFFDYENVAGTPLAGLPWSGIFYNNSVAQAVVARASDALVISFRGTNGVGDVVHWPEMDSHLSLFQPLIAAINQLISSTPAIKHVFVTGHSLGAAMVDPFMATHQDTALVDYTAITFAHPDYQTGATAAALDALLAGWHLGLAGGVVSFVNGIHAGIPNFGHDSRVSSYHNFYDLVRSADFANDGLIPGIANLISYTGDTVFAHDKQLYVYGADFLARSGVGDHIISAGLVGPGRNHFLIPTPGGIDNTLTSLTGGLLMVGGSGDDTYIVTANGIYDGDTIVEYSQQSSLVGDTLRITSGFGNFNGGVRLAAVGLDLYVYPMILGVNPHNLPPIRIFRHFTASGRVELIEWGGQSPIQLPRTAGELTVWNGNHYRTITFQDAQFVEAPDGTVSASINAVGGSGILDTVSFAELRNSVVADLLAGVASIVDGFSPTSPSPSGAAFTVGPASSIPVDISNMENVSGGSVDDTIAGSDVANYLEGREGNDYLAGLAGSDMLDGGEGDDRINGGTGADGLIGGGGDDQFRVDDLGDRIFEAVGGGRDTVFADTTYILSENAEVEILTVTNFDDLSAIALTGNAFGQEIWGNAGANILKGEGGNDFLFGGFGGDILMGGDGDDYLYGDGGSDCLTGGSGADRFMFELLTDSRSYALRSDGFKRLPDFITDFVSGEDKIDLSSIEPTAGVHAFTFIGADAFSKVAGQVRYDVHEGNIHVFADADGDGWTDLMFVVAGTTLQAGDFVL